MELTIDNIIKIAIGVFVIVAVVLGVYLAMNNYVIPYFSGIWSDNDGDNGQIGGGAEICEGKIAIGSFQVYNPGRFAYTNNFFFTKGNVPTKIYLEEGYIKFASSGGDPNIGKVVGTQIEIFSDSKTTKVIKDNNLKAYTDSLNGAYIGGNQVCK